MVTAETVPRRGPLVAVLLSQLAFGLLAMTICIPSMGQWPTLLQTSQANVQLTFSGFVVAYGGLQLLYGPLSDRLGRKRVLMLGLALTGLGSLAAALSGGIGALVAARVLQGAGAAAGMVVGRAAVQDLFEGPERTRVMAYVSMTLGVCPPLATIIGGQLHVRLGWQANFVLMALLAVVLLAATHRILPNRPLAAAPAAPMSWGWLETMAASYARLAQEPGFLLHVMVLSLTTATLYIFLAGAPLVLGAYGVGPDSMGLYIGCIPLAYIVGGFAASRLAHQVPARQMMAVGQALTLSGLLLVLLLAALGWRSPLAFALPLLLLGLGHGLLVPPTLAATVGLVPAIAGSAAAVTGLMQQLFGALGGYAVGWLPAQPSAALMAGLMLVCAGLSALATAQLLRRRAH